MIEIDSGLSARLESWEADVVQMASEALSNVGRHAQAETCRLRLFADEGEAVLDVEDDGCGFDVGGATGMGQGLGNLHDRVVGLGGRCEVTSELGSGSRVRISLPL